MKKVLSTSFFILALFACGGEGNEADNAGVGASCAMPEDCMEEGQTCLTQFTGGYCGLECVVDGDCPDGSGCVAHDDGNQYCFRLCQNKSECNLNRSEEEEANCSSSITWVDDAAHDGDKACVPPSAGI